MKKFYKVLKVSPDSTAIEIKRSYHKLIRENHPDISKDQNAIKITSELNEAYDTLGDPSKRLIYDLTPEDPMEVLIQKISVEVFEVKGKFYFLEETLADDSPFLNDVIDAITNEDLNFDFGKLNSVEKYKKIKLLKYTKTLFESEVKKLLEENGFDIDLNSSEKNVINNSFKKIKKHVDSLNEFRLKQGLKILKESVKKDLKNTINFVRKELKEIENVKVIKLSSESIKHILEFKSSIEKFKIEKNESIISILRNCPFERLDEIINLKRLYVIYYNLNSNFQHLNKINNKNEVLSLIDRLNNYKISYKNKEFIKFNDICQYKEIDEFFSEESISDIIEINYLYRFKDEYSFKRLKNCNKNLYNIWLKWNEVL